MPDARKPIISLRGITKHFGGVYAMRDVDLDIYRGEILALVGDNGAGKSTLIKIISGAYSADAGEILIDGSRVRIESPGDAKRLQHRDHLPGPGAHGKPGHRAEHLHRARDPSPGYRPPACASLTTAGWSRRRGRSWSG